MSPAPARGPQGARTDAAGRQQRGQQAIEGARQQRGNGDHPLVAGSAAPVRYLDDGTAQPLRALVRREPLPRQAHQQSRRTAPEQLVDAEGGAAGHRATGDRVGILQHPEFLGQGKQGARPCLTRRHPVTF